MQTIENPLKIPEIAKMQDKVTTIPNFTIPPIQTRDESSTKMIDRKTIQDIAKEIPIYTDPVYRPPPKPVKMPYPRFQETYWILNQNSVWISRTILHFE